MSTTVIAPGLSVWTLELATGETRAVLASSLRAAIGSLPVVSANKETVALPAPTVSALVPNTATIGDPSFTLKVQGTGFGPGSVIIFNGNDEPTTFVSPTEVTTGVNMAVWTAPSAPLPVLVRHADGRESGSLPFTFEAAA